MKAGSAMIEVLIFSLKALIIVLSVGAIALLIASWHTSGLLPRR
jgi:hypothetical protein